MEKTYSRTNLYLIDKDLWKWAKYRANTLGFNSVSEYLFKLIETDRNGWVFENVLKVDDKEDE